MARFDDGDEYEDIHIRSDDAEWSAVGGGNLEWADEEVSISDRTIFDLYNLIISDEQDTIDEALFEVKKRVESSETEAKFLEQINSLAELWIPSLIEIIKSRDTVRVRLCVAILKKLCDCDESRQQFVSSDGINVCINLLSPNSSPDLQEAAVDIVIELTISSVHAQKKVRQLGGIAKLVALLDDKKLNMKKKALLALQNTVERNGKNQLAFKDSSGILSLQKLFQKGNEDLYPTLLRTIGLVAWHNETLQLGVNSSGLIDEVFPFLESTDAELLLPALQTVRILVTMCMTNAKAFVTKKGLVQRVVAFLDVEDVTIVTEAAGTLWMCAKSWAGCVPQISEHGAIARLVVLAKAPQEGIQIACNGVICECGKNNSEVQNEVRRAGGIETILGLIQSPSHVVVAQAIEALHSLAEKNSANQASIGAIGLTKLVPLLDSTHESIRKKAAGAIAVIVDAPDSSKHQFQPLVVALGVMPKLNNLLSSRDPGAVVFAALALRNICSNNLDGRKISGEKGTVKTLISLLNHDDMGVKVVSLAALTEILTKVPTNQHLFTAHAGFEELRKLLEGQTVGTNLILDGVAKLVTILSTNSALTAALLEIGVVQCLLRGLESPVQATILNCLRALCHLAKNDTSALQDTKIMSLLLGILQKDSADSSQLHSFQATELQFESMWSSKMSFVDSESICLHALKLLDVLPASGKQSKTIPRSVMIVVWKLTQSSNNEIAEMASKVIRHDETPSKKENQSSSAATQYISRTESLSSPKEANTGKDGHPQWPSDVKPESPSIRALFSRRFARRNSIADPTQLLAIRKARSPVTPSRRGHEL